MRCPAPPMLRRNEDERRPSTSQANKTANKYGNSGRVTIDDTPGIPVHY